MLGSFAALRYVPITPCLPIMPCSVFPYPGLLAVAPQTYPRHPSTVMYQKRALNPHPAGLHDEAFQLAEAAFVGTQLTRALERVFASLAASCVRSQLAWGRAAEPADGPAAAAAAAGGDDMETDEAAAGGTVAAAAAGGGREGGGGAAAVADWRRLKDWLQRCGGSSGVFWQAACCCLCIAAWSIILVCI